MASRSHRYLARRISQDLGARDGGAVIVLSGLCAPDVVVENAMLLASALAAEIKARVLLIDGDLRDGTLSARFDLLDSAGLGEATTDADALDQLVHPTARENVLVLPRGHFTDAPGMDERARAILTKARTCFDIVLMTQQDAGGDTRNLTFARHAELVLLVAEDGVTRMADIDDAEAVFTIHDIENVQLLLSEFATSTAQPG